MNARLRTAGRSDPAREPREMRAGGARRECWPRREGVVDWLGCEMDLRTNFGEPELGDPVTPTPSPGWGLTTGKRS